MNKETMCPIHPKYKGKKLPKYSSNDKCICAQIYLLLHSKPRVLPMPTKVIKDRSKYTRKKKHKGKDI